MQMNTRDLMFIYKPDWSWSCWRFSVVQWVCSDVEAAISWSIVTFRLTVFCIGNHRISTHTHQDIYVCMCTDDLARTQNDWSSALLTHWLTTHYELIRHHQQTETCFAIFCVTRGNLTTTNGHKMRNIHINKKNERTANENEKIGTTMTMMVDWFLFFLNLIIGKFPM